MQPSKEFLKAAFLCELAGARYNEGRFTEALDAARRAVDTYPEHSGPWATLGRVQAEFCMFGLAGDAFEKAFELDPENYATWSNYFFMLFYSGASRREIDVAHHAWGLTQKAADINRKRYRGGRLRIGYLSPNFIAGSSGRHALPLFVHHDRSKVELFGYHVGPRDELTEVFEGLAETWRWMPHDGDDGLVAQIAADQIDVLVELSGHTNGTRLQALQIQPARYHLTSLDYACHPGTPAIQGYLGATSAHRNEPDWLTYDGAFLPAMSYPGLPAPRDYRTKFFGAFTRPGKLHNDTLCLWGRVLRAAPGYGIIVKMRGAHDLGFIDHLTGRMEACGLDPARVIFEEHQGYADYLRTCGRVCAILDSSPYGNGATTYDALTQGCPVITLRSDAYTGQATPSILDASGHSELVAASEDDYVAIAMRFAMDPAWTTVDDVNGMLPDLARLHVSELERIYAEISEGA
jgi:predicted O-linked N-acetylglucosamine transferase (SPINDLY family)